LQQIPKCEEPVYALKELDEGQKLLVEDFIPSRLLITA
jgi:hypothetical protein